MPTYPLSFAVVASHDDADHPKRTLRVHLVPIAPPKGVLLLFRRTSLHWEGDDTLVLGIDVSTHTPEPPIADDDTPLTYTIDYRMYKNVRQVKVVFTGKVRNERAADVTKL